MTEQETQRTALVLVVDDDWINREVMEAHLKGAGYNVHVAHSGRRALEMAFDASPDLVLLDVRMQDMSGYDVCKQLKSAEATRSALVMMVTALESDEVKQKAIAAGADDFISKPYTAMTILVRIRNLLRIKQLSDTLDQHDRRLREVLARHVDQAVIETILAELGRSSSKSRDTDTPVTPIPPSAG